MTFQNLLKRAGIPVAYGVFKNAPKPPFIVYLGAGQKSLSADDTKYHKANKYRVEYYFKTKNEEKEETIEKLLLDGGFLYEKSEDVYIESEDLYVIYYEV
jgi:hypothetical protein|nr:MAG TPA: tail completion protein [Caudoviricetes sp.]DAT42926.1 MAG TPA: tail completion protein [Caudoviricetes sp.]